MKSVSVMMLAVSVVIIIPNAGFGACLLLNLGPEQLVQAGDPCEDIVGYGSSVPTYADWNNDGKKDLIVGEGSRDFFGGNGKVRVYLNVGTASAPQFSDYFYAQSNGSDLTVPATAGCLGAFPRVVYWNAGDMCKDLLVGLETTFGIQRATSASLRTAISIGTTLMSSPTIG